MWQCTTKTQRLSGFCPVQAVGRILDIETA